jgi:thioesterase domain-containing protein
MEEIAAHYISEIIDQNPSGPYALAGYSFGGVIAFEMTRQLESMGKKVIMLAMLDSYAENADYFLPKTKKLAIKLQRQFPKFLYITKSLFSNLYGTLKYQAEYVDRRINEFLKTFKKQEISITDKINSAYEIAYKNYKMVKCDGLVDVFRVKTRLYYLPDRVYMGWLPFAKKGVEIHEIEGDHKTFLTPPRDKEFAKVLQKLLDERVAKES